MPDAAPIPAAERQSRAALTARQAERLRRLLLAIDGRNPFYTSKLQRAGIAPADLVLPRDLARLPLTTKAELVADQDAAPPWGTVLTYPVARYNALQPDLVDDGAPPAVARHDGELAVDARLLARGVPRGAGRGATTASCFRSPSDRSSASGPRSTPGPSSAPTACRPAG